MKMFDTSVNYNGTVLTNGKLLKLATTSQVKRKRMRWKNGGQCSHEKLLLRMKAWLRKTAFKLQSMA